MMPIVYDPTIVTTVEHYSQLSVQPQNAGFLSDVGTDNQQLLHDPMHLGNQYPRIQGSQYHQFINQFVKAVEALFPHVYLHFGARTAGAGITQRIFEEMVTLGLSSAEARKHFYLVDKQGLLFNDMPNLTPEQKPFARSREEFENADDFTDLLSVVKAVHPTIMVGTSTRAGAFTETVVKEMAAHTARPIIFPISNPTKLIEAHADDLIKWTKGRALVATGIPSKPVEYHGVTYEIGQANNALIYPGLGLGAIASTAKVLNDQMISAAAHSLGGIVDVKKPGAAVLPPVSKLADFSETVAEAVAQSAVDQQLNQQPIHSVVEAIRNTKWAPHY